MGMTNISQSLTIKQTTIANHHVYGILCVLAKTGNFLASRNVGIQVHVPAVAADLFVVVIEIHQKKYDLFFSSR